MIADKMLAEWLWIDRWMGSSAFLLPIEPRGLYREMLTQAWRRGARLPNDHEAIRRAIGATPAEWRRCWPKVEHYWTVEEEWLFSPTQRVVYQECLDLRERARAHARAGAQARHGPKKPKRQRVPEHVPGDSPPNSSETPLPPYANRRAPGSAAGPDGPPSPDRIEPSRPKIKCGPSDVDVDEHLRDDRTPAERARCATLKAETLSRHGGGKVDRLKPIEAEPGALVGPDAEELDRRRLEAIRLLASEHPGGAK